MPEAADPSATLAAAYLTDAVKRFREAKQQADRALGQVPFERWAERLDPESNSLVTLALHICGNQISRWTDFLTSDGEKPDRHRDAEFEDASLSREQLLARWERGWATLFAALESLTEKDLTRTVTIRSEPLTVVSAINRQIAHYGLHVGQMIFLAKHLAGPAWKSQSLPRKRG
jgi:hypothetical protein